MEDIYIVITAAASQGLGWASIDSIKFNKPDAVARAKELASMFDNVSVECWSLKENRCLWNWEA